MKHDLVIANGRVVSGLDEAPRVADVAIRGGTIAAIGPGLAGAARRVIQAEGCLVCPGFIDIHSHSDLDLLCARGAELKLLQGVTTDVIGNCGFSFYPVCEEHAGEALDLLSVLFPDATAEHLCADAAAYVRRLGSPGTNVVSLVGHNLLRIHANGCERDLAAGALNRMQALLERQFAGGARGVSTGLLYTPACFAAVAELTALATLTRAHAGLFSCHIRDEGDQLEAAIAEVLAVQAASGVALEISHLKASGRRNWGKVAAVLETLAATAAGGRDVSYDCYPFVFGCSTILTLLPTAVLDADLETLCARLLDPAMRAHLRLQMSTPASLLGSVGAEHIVVAGATAAACQPDVGRSLADSALATGKDVVDVVLDLVIADRGQTSIFLFQMDEDDVRRTLSHPLGLLGSDGIPVRHGIPHPRLLSAFLQMLSRYVVQEGLLPLPAAVRKLTANPARKLRLPARGSLAPGQAADVVVVDLERIRPAADPFLAQPFRGVDAVVLNGQVVVESTEYTGQRAGVVLTR